MQQANQIQNRDLLDVVIGAIIKVFVYGLLGVAASFLLVSTFIGFQELPNRYDAAKKQYIDYQVKINNPEYVNALNTNE